jgi:hypothetical protein
VKDDHQALNIAPQSMIGRKRKKQRNGAHNRWALSSGIAICETSASIVKAFNLCL